MRDDTTDGGDQAQLRPRIIWRDNNRPFVVDDLEPDGVVRIVPLRIVPAALFRAGHNVALPDWALDSPDIIDSPPLQFLTLINVLVEQRRTAVAALCNIRIPLKAARIRSSGRRSGDDRTAPRRHDQAHRRSLSGA